MRAPGCYPAPGARARLGPLAAGAAGGPPACLPRRRPEVQAGVRGGRERADVTVCDRVLGAKQATNQARRELPPRRTELPPSYLRDYLHPFPQIRELPPITSGPQQQVT